MFEASILAIGLAMDATAVATARSVAGTSRRELLVLALSFGIFQAGMAAMGWLLGASTAQWFSRWDHWIAFGLLLLIGGKMLIAAIRGHGATEGSARLGVRTLIVLSVATSIDALAAGVTLPALEASPAISLALIGFASFALSALGGAIGTRLGARAGSKLEILGGLALIGIGVKTLVDHLTADRRTPPPDVLSPARRSRARGGRSTPCAPLRGQHAVGGAHGPAVGVGAVAEALALIIGSTVNAMPSRRRCPSGRPTWRRAGLHRAADAVAPVFRDDAPRADMAHDRRTDVAEPPARYGSRDPGAPAPRASSTSAHACGAASLITNVAGVAVVAIELGGDVDIDDVAVRQPNLRARHAVAHDVVATDAHRGGEAVIAELRGPSALRLGVRAHQPIDLGRRHPRHQPLANVRQGRRRSATGAPHAVTLDRRQDRDGHVAHRAIAGATVQYLFGLDGRSHLGHDRGR
ncbi:MAG: manganese efflux pump MntP family protein [Kofleriaceae bacterium]